VREDARGAYAGHNGGGDGEGSEDGFGVRRSSDCTTHLDEELDMLEETQREDFYIPWIERVPEAHVPKEG
jgi:hypothetical protein